jgi:hypothetical protein
MAKNTIADLDTTASNNTDVLAQSTQGTAAVSTIDTMIQNSLALLARFYADLGGTGTVGGTADAITLTTASTYQALENGLTLAFKAGSANTGAATINVDSLGAKAIRRIGDSALSAGDIAANGVYLLRYDTAYNGAAGAWILLNSGSGTAATTSAAGIVELAFSQPYNLGLAVSVAGNALTIALKDADGNDPSSSSPVVIPFRNVTAATGTPTYLTVTAATSLTVSSGSTLGTTSGVAANLVVVGFNDGGTFRLGVVNPTSLPVKDRIASSTAEGGAGGADTAGTIYTGTAVTSKALRVLGLINITEATAGTWASDPTTVQIGQASETAMQPEVGKVLAWVNFNGTGTPAIRGSGNVSSITDNGVGGYTVNFTNALPDGNYAVIPGVSTTASFADNIGIMIASNVYLPGVVAPTTSSITMQVVNATTGAARDVEYVTLTIVR